MKKKHSSGVTSHSTTRKASEASEESQHAPPFLLCKVMHAPEARQVLVTDSRFLQKWTWQPSADYRRQSGYSMQFPRNFLPYTSVMSVHGHWQTKKAILRSLNRCNNKATTGWEDREEAPEELPFLSYIYNKVCKG